MSYYSKIKIALTEYDYDKVQQGCHKALDSDKYREQFKKLFQNRWEFVKDNEDNVYIIIVNDSVQWDTSNPAVSYMADFLKKNRHSFIRVGEDVGDIEVDILNEDEDGVDVIFDEILSVNTEIITNM